MSPECSSARTPCCVLVRQTLISIRLAGRSKDRSSVAWDAVPRRAMSRPRRAPEAGQHPEGSHQVLWLRFRRLLSEPFIQTGARMFGRLVGLAPHHQPKRHRQTPDSKGSPSVCILTCAGTLGHRLANPTQQDGYETEPNGTTRWRTLPCQAGPGTALPQATRPGDIGNASTSDGSIH
jgi:hypothetical protein